LSLAALPRGDQQLGEMKNADADFVVTGVEHLIANLQAIPHK
jgi:hypothetical protein